ncbi:MAG: acetyl-CoA carboxylase biotin carboxyl carrier protein subunit [Bacteroidetes bacterium]|nr:MAG: acetyl-CoA carboxylase biotin carboxyl carrier protein subunit [Bacteroidota bacterium]
MPTEININDRNALVEVLSRDGDKVRISIDGKKYDADVVMVEEGVYSIIIDNKSHNIELIRTDNKNYEVNTYAKSYDVEIVDAESKYLKSRRRDDGDEEAVMSSPMPGKIVKILVKVGDKVKAGDTVIIVSAMKMESEYKVKKDRIIKDIKVKEGDTIQADQPLVVIE